MSGKWIAKARRASSSGDPGRTIAWVHGEAEELQLQAVCGAGAQLKQSGFRPDDTPGMAVVIADHYAVTCFLNKL